ncbi:hypothetical protein [Streptomyces sp. NPDC047974]|uniref:hypothetical protein n=1 Tax=Streptomyces sp. NPDC047974 TaxID=3154343 RepID=UPI0033C9ECD0
MGEFVGAAFGLPGLVLTTALVAAVGFWVLVLCRVVAPDTFDADVDTESLGLGDTSGATAASVVIGVAWVLHLVGVVLLGRTGLSGSWFLLLSVLLLPTALTLSWLLVRHLFGRRQRTSPSDTHQSAVGRAQHDQGSARTAV